MSYDSWLRSERRQRTPPEQAAAGKAALFLRLFKDEPRTFIPQETPYPDKFHRYCPQHNERLNWLLCPKGHELGSADVWIVKDEETGEVIDVCRDNDGTQQWTGFAPRH